MKVLIVDDEQLAREGLELLLRQHRDLEIVGHCRNGHEAVSAIRSSSPDLVFLDINMPGMSGLDVIREIGPSAMPSVIFVTAYDEYAVDAFRVNAVDYLLKPLNETGLAEALDRARLKSGIASVTETRLLSLLESLHVAGADRVMIRANGRVRFLRADEILWIEADGDYVTVHTQDASYLLRETMKNMADRLPAERFQRIHRSSVVSLDAIRELVSNDNGDYDVVLADGTVTRLSRSYREELFRKMVPGWNER